MDAARESVLNGPALWSAQATRALRVALRALAELPLDRRDCHRCVRHDEVRRDDLSAADSDARKTVEPDSYLTVLPVALLDLVR